METAIAVAAIIALLGVMMLIGRVRRMRSDIKYMKRLEAQQPFRPYLNGHSSQRDWRRAAEFSQKASQERRDG